MDPDEYIIKEGKDSFLYQISNAINLIDYKMELLKKNKDFGNIKDISSYVNSALKELVYEKDDIVVELNLKKLATSFDIDYDNLVNKYEKLKNDNLLDDTIIVAFTDHPNKLVIRDDETEKLNKTIFYIYDHDMNSNQIDTITSSINILPTVINLFGIKNNYLYSGYDALDTNEEYVIFKDYTYFDGKEVKTVTKEYKDKLEYSSDILSSDYYKDNTVKK